MKLWKTTNIIKFDSQKFTFWHQKDDFQGAVSQSNIELSNILTKLDVVNKITSVMAIKLYIDKQYLTFFEVSLEMVSLQWWLSWSHLLQEKTQEEKAKVWHENRTENQWQEVLWTNESKCKSFWLNLISMVRRKVQQWESADICKTRWRLCYGLELHLSQWFWRSCQN